jgi:hypothetical protein
MSPKTPVVDLFIGRDASAWRLYFAPRSCVPAAFARRVNERREIYPVGRPDAEDLRQFMWETDSPYEHRVTADGGIEILAEGRSAITLIGWLRDLVDAAVGGTASSP